MRRPRPSVRLRLAGLVAALVLAAGALLLGVSYLLLDAHFERTLPPMLAADTLADLRAQYALALAGVTLVAFVLGWLLADRALRPLRAIAATARRVSEDSLGGERVAVPRPAADELRELSDSFDGMLTRLDGAFAAQRRFVGHAAHELRAPLAALRTEVDVALADPDASTEDLRAMGEAVREETERCAALIDALLALARSEAAADGDVDVDLAGAVHDALAELAPAIAERRIDVRVDPSRGPLLVRGSDGLLRRLVFNLLDNSARHNRPGGFVAVAVRAQRDRVVLVVDNGGERIADAAVATLADPFVRAGREREGAGLGLSIVRAVAERHDGTLALAARPGGGLTATVDLPRVRTSDREPSRRDSLDGATRRRRAAPRRS